VATFLSGCQDLRRECGVSGTGPSTVISQTGELGRLVNWYKQAWVEIQNKKPSWRWMRSQFTVQTVSSDDSYAYGDCTDSISSAVISRFKRWYRDDFYIYLTSAGVGTQTKLMWLDWDDFKRMYLVGTQTASGPAHVSIDPLNNIRLGPKPNGIYTLTGDYQKSAQSLALDADIPEMPADFHMLIVYQAMKKYSAYSAAPEVWAQAKDEASRMMRDLELDQLPLPSFGDALV
jgi:hypothetical protein